MSRTFRAARRVFKTPASQIKYPSSMQHVGTKGGSSIVHARYTPGHAYLSDRIAQLGTESVFHKTQLVYESRTEPLWWACSCSKNNGGNKKVVRSWIMRRLRVAFVESLKRIGYDKDGYPLEEAISEEVQEPLFATINMYAQESLAATKFTELQGEMDLLVKTIIRIHRKKLTNDAKGGQLWSRRGDRTMSNDGHYRNESGKRTDSNDRSQRRSDDRQAISHRAAQRLSGLGKVEAGVTVLLTHDKRLVWTPFTHLVPKSQTIHKANLKPQIEFPSILLPPNISSGSIVDITVARNLASEEKIQSAFLALQDNIYRSFGAISPSPPVLRCRNATQTSVVLEWDPIELATSDVISLSLFRNGQKAGSIPRPGVMQSTKISGLAVDTEYIFHLVLKTTAGTFSSERVTVKTHKMTDLSGITVTPGILPAQLRDSLTKAIERIGAKITDTVRIDTTHFVTTEGRGLAWEKAVEMNIPVVRPEWVEGCERGGRIVGVRQYYLDADPRQRQVAAGLPTQHPQQQQKPETVKESAPSPRVEGDGTNGHTPPPPPAKDTEKVEGGNSEDEEEEQEEPKSAVADEPKSRVEDRQQKLALRPADATPKEKKDEEGSDSGDVTPGNSSFQDVAL
ncbi:hypothetical protein B7494_g2737 [Chlorociboria aeruginascens]|nr:hypothetical protein B7494_g2737 [Chlorociboria aeruginascens]